MIRSLVALNIVKSKDKMGKFEIPVQHQMISHISKPVTLAIIYTSTRKKLHLSKNFHTHFVKATGRHMRKANKLHVGLEPHI